MSFYKNYIVYYNDYNWCSVKNMYTNSRLDCMPIYIPMVSGCFTKTTIGEELCCNMQGRSELGAPNYMGDLRWNSSSQQIYKVIVMDHVKQ